MDKVWPTFGHSSVHEWKLMKLNQYLTVSPSHYNIFLKSLGLLQKLMGNCKILQKLKIFHETNGISWCFCITMYLLTFGFDFGTFKRWLQNFGFIQTDLKFWSIKLGDGES